MSQCISQDLKIGGLFGDFRVPGMHAHVLMGGLQMGMSIPQCVHKLNSTD